jgi:hypothetical protein
VITEGRASVTAKRADTGCLGTSRGAARADLKRQRRDRDDGRYGKREPEQSEARLV